MNPTIMFAEGLLLEHFLNLLLNLGHSTSASQSKHTRRIFWTNPYSESEQTFFLLFILVTF